MVILLAVLDKSSCDFYLYQYYENKNIYFCHIYLNILE